MNDVFASESIFKQLHELQIFSKTLNRLDVHCIYGSEHLYIGSNAESLFQGSAFSQDVPNHVTTIKKVQVGKDQEKAQSEKDWHSKNRGGKKPN